MRQDFQGNCGEDAGRIGMEKYICPVCGYSGLDEPSHDPITGSPSFDICPCCGCEFGYNDATPSAKEDFLKTWIAQGTPWFEPALKPMKWNIRTQLKTIGRDFNAFK